MTPEKLVEVLRASGEPMSTAELAGALGITKRGQMLTLLARSDHLIQCVGKTKGPTGFVNYLWRVRK